MATTTKFDPISMELIKVTPGFKEKFKPITTGQIFGTDNNFNPEGLFSTEIFGMVGTEERNNTFARIDLNTKIMTPVVYRIVVGLSSLYQRIMDGTEYAVFDDKLKDFVISNDEKAKTGYSYFISKLHLIKFRETESLKRSEDIKLVYKAIKDETIFIDQLLVLPAGMRDYIQNENGRPEEDEINTYYRTIISRASLIDPVRAKSMPTIYDANAVGIQKAVLELNRYVFTLLSGKGKLIQGKYASRKVFNTTSNVVSSYVDRTTGLNDPRTFRSNETRVGLYQFLRSSAPISTYNVKNKYISQIFPEGVNSVFLTNYKTMKREEVSVRGIQKDMDLWRTSQGLDKIFASLANVELRGEPILFKGSNMDGKNDTFSMGLVYSDDEVFKFFQDIDELPEKYDKSKVRHVTLFEFLYMSVYHMSGEYPGMITRYPVSGYGSIYPSMVVLTTTIDTKVLRELDYNWEPLEGDKSLAIFFPDLNSGYMGSLIIHPSHLSRLGGDRFGLKVYFYSDVI